MPWKLSLLAWRQGSKSNVHTWIRRMSSRPVKVEVQQGTIVGRERLLPNGAPFHSFQGVPYAVPPLGELRFMAPLPLERFAEPELDCTKERDVSHQRDPISLQVMGSEDCLFLNIYAPREARGPLPVMAWIHGGGFFFGNANSDFTFPLHLLEEDVVIVTINYRLGALGFLCLPEAGIWGNAGLKDQRLALEWIQANIARFNGDPQNVTLFGESAGAAAVHLHAYASHAHQLFHKAIMQSGTANMEWVFQANPTYKARRLTELLGCQSNEPCELLRFLQSDAVSPLALLSNTMAVLTPDEKRRGLPLPFKPVIEDTASPDRFIAQPIMETLQRPGVLRMPTLMGYNSAEGIAMVVNAAKRLALYEDDFARLVPRNIPVAPDDALIRELARRMRDFYLDGQRLSPALLDSLTNLLSDYHFTVDMQRAAELQARCQPQAELFFYRFDYVGQRNIYKRIFQMEHLQGACHADELFYLFQMAGDDSVLDAKDALISRRLCKLWTNFARSGQPTPLGPEPPAVPCHWRPVPRVSGADQSFSLEYLAIDEECRMCRNPDEERIEFWRNIYDTYTPTDYSKLSSKL